MYNNELYHHGVKGQKWGVRRYQNPDGSLTSEGQKRYQDLTKPEKTWKTDALAKAGIKNGILKKGNTITRATVKGEELTDRRIFAAVLQCDIDKYGYAVQNGKLDALTNPNGEDAYQIVFEATKNLKIASSDDQTDFYIQENADKTVKEVLSHLQWRYEQGKNDSAVYDALVKEFGDVPIGKFADSIKAVRDRDETNLSAALTNDEDRDLMVQVRKQQYLDVYTRLAMLDDLRTLEPGEGENENYLRKRQEAFLNRMGKAGYDIFVDAVDDGRFSEYPLIVTKPNTKFKIQSKQNYRKKFEERTLTDWRKNPNLLRTSLRNKHTRKTTLNTMANVWYKMTDSDKKLMSSAIPFTIRKQHVRKMDQFAKYLNEHPNSDMHFDEFEAMLKKDDKI